MSILPMLKPGGHVGNYILQDVVGRGAFAVVWRAVHHERPNRVVAVKIATDSAYRRQLAREGRLPDIDHPNVVPILDADTRFAVAPYIVMPYYIGGSLADLLMTHRNGVPANLVRSLIEDILSGLRAAHERGIVHRDIKPSNVLLGDSGRALVTDFGLSTANPEVDLRRSILQSASLEAEQSVDIRGTLAYMAPELRDGAAATPASDVFSVGVLLFELLTGRLPCGPELPSESSVHLLRDTAWDRLYARACRPRKHRFGDAAEMLDFAQGRSLPTQLLKGHGSYVRCMAFSPDGCELITAGDDRTVRRWNLNDTREIGRFDYDAAAVAFSPCGSWIALGLVDGTVLILDPLTAVKLRRLREHEKAVQSVAFSGDGKLLLAGSSDGMASTWEVTTGKLIHVYNLGHAINQVAYTSGGVPVLMGATNGAPKVWTTSRRHFVELEADAETLETMSSFVLSPNGRFVLGSGSTSEAVRVWETRKGRECRRLEHDVTVTAATFTPDCRHVLAIVAHAAQLWSIHTGRRVQETALPGDGEYELTMSSNGRLVAYSALEASVSVLELGRANEPRRLVRRMMGHSAAVERAMFVCGKVQVVTTSHDGTARLWDVASGREICRREESRESWQHVLSTDGGKVLACPLVRTDYSCRLWDTCTGDAVEMRECLSGLTGPFCVIGALSPRGERVLAMAAFRLCLCDTLTGRVVWRASEDDCATVPAGRWRASLLNRALPACFDASGQYALAVVPSGSIVAWDAETGSEIRRFEGFGDWATSVTFSCDARSVLTGSADGLARLWDMATGVETRTFEHDVGVTAVAFGQHENHIVTGTSSGDVILWDAAVARKLKHYRGHEDRIRSVYMSADGRWVLTGSDDWTARMWDVLTGEEIRRFGVQESD